MPRVGTRGSSVGSGGGKGSDMKSAEPWYLRPSSAVEHAVSKFLAAVTLRAARRPLLYIVVPLALASVCLAGFVRFNLELEFAKFMIPQDSRQVEELESYREVWGEEVGSVAIMWDEDGDPGVLAKDRLVEMHRSLLLTSRAVGSDGTTHEDVCERIDGRCSVASVLLYFECIELPCIPVLTDAFGERLSGLSQAAILARVSDPSAVDSWLRPLSLLRRRFLGGVTPSEASDAVNSTATVTGATHAVSVLTNRYGGEADVESGLLAERSAVECWETAFLDAWPDVERSAVLASRAEQDGIVETSTGNFDFVAASMLLMVLFIVAALSRGPPFGRSRIALALLGVSIVSFSVLVAYGITVAVGFALTPATQLSFFILLSIGADIVFALTAEFDRRKAAFIEANSVAGPAAPGRMSRDGGGGDTDSDGYQDDGGSRDRGTRYVPAALLLAAIPDLISDAVEAIGPSLLYTGITSFLAFISTSSTAFPILRNFAVSTGFAVLINCALMFTVFVGGLALDERRKIKGKKDCLCFLGTAEETVPVNHGAVNAISDDDSTLTDLVHDSKTTMSSITRKEMDIALSSKSAPRLERVFHRYGRIFSRKGVAIGIAIIWAGCIAFAAYGTSLTDASFDAADFLPNGSRTKRFIDARDDGFGEELGDEVAFDLATEAPGGFASLEVQETLERLYLGIVSSEWFRADQTFSPFHEALVAARASGVATATGFIPPQLFDAVLNQTLSAPGLGSILAADVVRGPGGSVARARVRAEHVPIPRLGGDSVRAMDSGLGLCDAATSGQANGGGGNDVNEDGIDDGPGAMSRCVAYTGTAYPFALMVRIVKREIFPQVAVAWALVSAFLLLTNHPLAAAIMSVLLAAAVVCLLGLIRLAGIAVDPTSLASIVISSGLVADFMVHISHVAVTASAPVGADGSAAFRVRTALRKMGPSVLQAGISTVLGTGILLFARARGFLYFAGVFILTVCVGLTTGLVVLPAVLRLALGPSNDPSEPHPPAKHGHRDHIVTVDPVDRGAALEKEIHPMQESY